MISKKTAQEIWQCYDALDRCKILYDDMAIELEKTGDERLIDAFGRKKGLELGVPSGSSGHRIFNVRIDLAMKIIEAHIEDNKKRLIELKAIGEIELKGDN